MLTYIFYENIFQNMAFMKKVSLFLLQISVITDSGCQPACWIAFFIQSVGFIIYSR